MNWLRSARGLPGARQLLNGKIYMKKIAFLFPGQGSQYVGMGKEFYDSFPAVKKIFDHADTVLNRKISDIIFNGPAEMLTQTENTQPAVFTLSCAIYSLLSENGILPVMTAGHSLGEYAALFAAGVFSFEQGLKLVEIRGSLIREASQKNPGSLCAIVGLSKEQINELAMCGNPDEKIQPVNFNCPGQTVIAGTHAALDFAENRAKEMGALKVVKLNVAGPFHSSYMRAAAVSMNDVLKTAHISEPKIQIISNCDAEKTTTKDEVVKKLSYQIDHPVLWEKTIHAFLNAQIDLCIEVGPGRVLTGFNRRIDKKLLTINVENIKTFHNAVQTVKENNASTKIL